MSILSNTQYLNHLKSNEYKAEWVSDYMKFGGHSLAKAECDFSKQNGADIARH